MNANAGITHGPAGHAAATVAGSFADVLRRNFEPQAWSRLHAHIRERFDGSTLHFGGIMTQVYRSPAGAIIAWLLQSLHVLPRVNARDTAFDFSIAPVAQGFRKVRNYRFGADDTFTFASTFNDTPALHEQFPAGLGMNLQLCEEHGALRFRDCGYFVKIGRWRLPLPRILAVGSFELLHRNIDRERFQVLIRIHHPLFGTLFYQRGEFRAEARDPVRPADPHAVASRGV